MKSARLINEEGQFIAELEHVPELDSLQSSDTISVAYDKELVIYRLIRRNIIYTDVPNSTRRLTGARLYLVVRKEESESE